MWKIFRLFKKDKLNKLKSKHDKSINKALRTEEKIKNTVFSSYMNVDDRKKLLDDAKTFHYSESKIANIEKAFENFNKDAINYNIAEDIIEARNHIDEYNTESFFSKIANVIIQEDN